MTADLPDYVLDPSPLALFTRLQRVGLHLERLQGESMAEIDMTFADYTLLATLHREPTPHALPVSRLAELVLRPMGSITQVVDRLERSGFVARRLDPDDRRRVLIELTDAGVDIAARGDKAYRVARERVLASLPAADVGRIDEAVTVMLLALETDQERMGV
ncbi:MAG: MarR family transcriptional regulator [Acidimicrobiales bacterium]